MANDIEAVRYRVGLYKDRMLAMKSGAQSLLGDLCRRRDALEARRREARMLIGGVQNMKSMPALVPPYAFQAKAAIRARLAPGRGK